jgi:hypothetical protein
MAGAGLPLLAQPAANTAVASATVNRILVLYVEMI